MIYAAQAEDNAKRQRAEPTVGGGYVKASA